MTGMFIVVLCEIYLIFVLTIPAIVIKIGIFFAATVSEFEQKLFSIWVVAFLTYYLLCSSALAHLNQFDSI